MRIETIGDPQLVEPALTSAKKSRLAWLSNSSSRGASADDPPIVLVLAVEDAHRVALEPQPAVLGQAIAKASR